MHKLYCIVLNERLYEWTNVNNIIPDEQNGFRKKVNRNIPWLKLGGLEIDNNCKMLNALKLLYVDVQSCVRVNGYYSGWFYVSNGLKQGCIPPPFCLVYIYQIW